jgi:hypothetical protein
VSFYSLTPTAASVVTVTPQSGAPDVRKFDDSALNQAIDNAIRNIPADKHVVALARVDLKGAHLTIAGKIPSSIPGELDWTVYADKPWDGPFDAGLGVRWSI